MIVYQAHIINMLLTISAKVVWQGHFQELEPLNVLRVQMARCLQILQCWHVLLIARQAITKMVQSVFHVKQAQLHLSMQMYVLRVQKAKR